MEKEKIVLMLSQNNFPNGDAGSIRDLHFAKIYASLGYKVYMICKNNNCISGEYDGVSYYSINNKSRGIKKILNYIKYTTFFKNILRNHINKKIDIIHLYDAPIGCIKYIKKISKKYDIQIIHDSVEWYSASEFKFGIFDKSYILKNLLNRIIIRKPIKVIAISTFLEKYYSKKGIKCIRIPIIQEDKIFDIDDESNKNDDKVQIIYAGSPGKKDKLDKILYAYSKLDKFVKEKIVLNIVGVSLEHANKIIRYHKNQIKFDGVNFYGRLDHKKVLEVMKKMDFSILVRDANERYAKAGFPTKVTEAMNNGLAICCNYSSDLKMYLKDDENSIIIKDDSIENIMAAFNRIYSLKAEDIKKIKLNSKETFKRYFNYILYVDKIREFIEKR